MVRAASSRSATAPIPSAEATDAPGQSWGRLMAAAQAGDADAYRTLLVELDPWLRRCCARCLPSAMTEDAVQDVLLAIHEKRHTYDLSRPFGPWLAAIARYKWADRLRSLKVEAALTELKPPQAEAIRPAKLRGCGVEGTSRAMGQSISPIRVSIHRGLERLTTLIRATGNAG